MRIRFLQSFLTLLLGLVSTASAQERPEATLVQLPARAFHSTDSTAPRMEQVAASAAPGLFLVQLRGPLQKAWMPQILGKDLELVSPLAPYNLIVWGPAAAVRRAAALPFVRWSGPYLPEDRVPSELTRPESFEGRLSVLVYEEGKLQRRIVPAAKSALSETLAALASEPSVLAVGRVAARGSIRDEMSDQIVADNAPSGQPTSGYQAFLTAKGVDGAGVTVGVVDQGSDVAHPELLHDGALCLDYTGSSPARACSSPTWCGSHGTETAGIVLGDGSSGVSFLSGGQSFLEGQGIAPGARLLAQNFLCTPDAGSTPPEGPLGWLHLSQDQVQNGAYISANSWGPQGRPQGYDADTREFDRMPRDGDPATADAAEPIVFVLSIMNGSGGTSTQGTPDEGKNLIRVGGSKNKLAGSIGDLCSCTAHGPALDGRMLPDLVAPGQVVQSTKPGGGHTASGVTGTSFASPHVSGAAALLTSWFQADPKLGYTPSPALVKAILVGSAEDLYGGLDADGAALGHRPDNKQGWGRLNLDRAIRPELPTLYFDQAQERTFTESGQEFSVEIHAAQPGQPMRVSLVWTDALGAGLGGSSAAWVNDLDLSLVREDLYLGNVFADGWSTPGGAADFKNNVENVFVQSPGLASWMLRVEAHNILGDGVWAGAPSTSAQDFDQDFALYCHNCQLGPPPSTVGSASPAVGLLSILLAAALGGLRLLRRPARR